MPEAAPLRVLKFGGTALATPERRQRAVDEILRQAQAGVRLVVVVSALGRRGAPYATDTLLELMREAPQAPARECDAAAACGEALSAALMAALLAARGRPAISLRGFQAGIVTDEHHGRACIREIRTARLTQELARGRIVVVAGYQGITAAGDVSTLGRGGSDTTAVALGVVLGASQVVIYTDVPGVMSADPRTVPDAHPVREITFDESAELTFKGADVLHPRAAELARQVRTAVVVRSAAAAGQDELEGEGTWLVAGEGSRLERATGECAVAVTSRSGIAQVQVGDAHLRDDPGVAAGLFGAIAQRGVTLDMMSVGRERIAFTCELAALDEVRAALDALGLEHACDPRCAKVTLVGAGIHGVPGVMHRMVRALAESGIRVLQSVDSNMIIGVLVAAEHEAAAVRAVHAEFFPPPPA